MSSKTPEDPAPAAPAARPTRGAWSITSRLTWCYGLSTVVLLLVAAAFLDWGLRRSLLAQDHALVASKVHVLQLLLRDHSAHPEILAGEVEHEAGEGQSLRYFLRVLDQAGSLRLETPGMAAVLPTALFPPPPLPGLANPAVARELADGRRYLLLSAHAIEAGEPSRERILQVGLDVSHNDRLLAAYRRQLLLMLGGGALVAALAGALVARAGLRPVLQLTAQAERITASRLDERINPARWPGELRALAAAFDGMLDRLRDSFARLSDCTADMAHALRNPINNLRGEAEVALARDRPARDYQQTLASSLEELDRLSRLIDGLLFIARTDNPGAALEHRRFAARPEMEAVREFYEALAGEKGITVTCEGDAILWGDPMLFRRAISNLLANALKHTPAAGRVSITARPVADNGAELTVADSGAGIPEAGQSRVFDRFYQVVPSGDQTSHGAGLGLAIVRSIMRLHGGTASLTSAVGQGTVVTLNFSPPFPPPAAAPEASVIQ